MYFWNIEGLKKQLGDQGLSEYHLFLYILIYVSLVTLTIEFMSFFPTEAHNPWDYVASALASAIAIAGTVYAFQANGGATGREFAPRFFSISLVVTIRFIVLFVALMIAKEALKAVLSMDDGQTSLLDILIYAGWNIWLYVAIADHIREVAIVGTSRAVLAHAS